MLCDIAKFCKNIVKSVDKQCNCDWMVNAMHNTASTFINDDESGLYENYEAWLEQLAHMPH